MAKVFSVATVLGMVALAACAPTVPDSGVGFQDYTSYEAQREAALTRGQPLSGAAAQPIAPTSPTFSTTSLGAAIDRAEGVTPAAPTDGGFAPATEPGQPGAIIGAPMSAVPLADPAAPAGNNSGISDEQNFDAVAARETIESDAERLARNRSQYQVVPPTALPQRSGSSGPNIVEFAISTSHPVGAQMYKRSSLSLSNLSSACDKFASPDLAQEAFLAAGGPDRDRKGLDPDGDGYACSWNPMPFRAAVN